MDWCGSTTDWYKECAECDAGFWVEAKDFNDARELMLQHFCANNGSKSGRDQLQHYCRSCQNDIKYNRIRTVHRNELIEAQNYKCAICARDITFNTNVKGAVAVDHDHNTGIIRGVLCRSCNVRMHAVDDKEWLAKAIAYRDLSR